MSPEAAERLQIEAYRRMSGEERLVIRLRLHELSCELAREGIRAANPQATAEQVEEKLRQRIRIGYEIDARRKRQS